MLSSLIDNYPTLNGKLHVGMYVYSMHVVYMYSILDCASSFLMKKLPVTKTCQTPISSFYLHAIDWIFQSFFLGSVSSFKWGQEKHPDSIKQIILRKRSKHKQGQEVVLTATLFIIAPHRFSCIIFLKASMLLDTLNPYLLFHCKKNKSNNQALYWFC